MSTCAHGPSPANSCEELRGERRGALAQRRAVLHVRERRVDVAPVARDGAGTARRGRRCGVRPRRCGRAIRRRSRSRPRRGRRARAPSRPVSVARSSTCVAPSRRDVPERVGEHEPALGVGVDDLDRLAVRGAEDVAGPERVAAGQVLGGGEDGDRAHRSAERGERADPVQRPGAAGHVALHVLHPAGRLDRDAAGVERDRLADEPEQDVVARAGRVVAEDDQARLVAAAAADGGQRAHAELVELLRGREPRTSGARARRASSCAFSPSVCGRELVRRHVREVARAVRPLGDDARRARRPPAARGRRRGR